MGTEVILGPSPVGQSPAGTPDPELGVLPGWSPRASRAGAGVSIGVSSPPVCLCCRLTCLRSEWQEEEEEGRSGHWHGHWTTLAFPDPQGPLTTSPAIQSPSVLYQGLDGRPSLGTPLWRGLLRDVTSQSLPATLGGGPVIVPVYGGIDSGP